MAIEDKIAIMETTTISSIIEKPPCWGAEDLNMTHWAFTVHLMLEELVKHSATKSLTPSKVPLTT